MTWFCQRTKSTVSSNAATRLGLDLAWFQLTDFFPADARGAFRHLNGTQFGLSHSVHMKFALAETFPGSALPATGLCSAYPRVSFRETTANILQYPGCQIWTTLVQRGPIFERARICFEQILHSPWYSLSKLDGLHLIFFVDQFGACCCLLIRGSAPPHSHDCDSSVTEIVTVAADVVFFS